MFGSNRNDSESSMSVVVQQVLVINRNYQEKLDLLPAKWSKEWH